ncbi:MAG: ribosome biogenesis GTP-binding protein YihA/YsxC [Alphaproteobacteria bacterium]
MSLFKKPCRFIAGAATPDALPPCTHPEIAFIGRSNVGKSSIINALVGQKALARTSQTPGRTQQLNFFLLDERLMMVDMPGYGHASVSKKEKRQWSSLTKNYLMGRQSLKRICLLIDSRRGVMEIDDNFMDLLDETAVSYQIVLTKADTLKPKELEDVLQNVHKALKLHAAAHPQILVTSAADKQGIESLQEELAAFALSETRT